MPANTVIKLRRDTAANWAGVTLADGELGIVNSGDDKGKFKIGDGTTVWGTLPYANPDDFISSIVGGDTTPLSQTSGELTLTGGFTKYVTGTTSETHVRFPKVTVKAGETGPVDPSIGDVWIKFTA